MDSRIETLLDALVNGGTLPEDYEPMSRNEAYLYALYKKGVGGSGGVQPDWNQNDETAPDYVKNKTHIVSDFSPIPPRGSVEEIHVGLNLLRDLSDVAMYLRKLALCAEVCADQDNTYELCIEMVMGTGGYKNEVSVSLSRLKTFMLDKLNYYATNTPNSSKYFVIIDPSVLPSEYKDMFSVPGIYFEKSENDTVTYYSMLFRVLYYNRLNRRFIGAEFPRVSTAEVGQTIIVKSVDGNGKPTKWEAVDTQPDWNQNDETAPDYVKNKPFYEKTAYTTLQEEITVTLDSSGQGQYDGSWYPNAGTTYTVIWDGTSYEGVAYNDSDECGNLELEINGEKIRFYESSTIYGTANMAGQHTFSIGYVDSSIEQIDEKYIPSSVPRLPSASQFDIPYVAALEGDTMKWGSMTISDDYRKFVNDIMIDQDSEPITISTDKYGNRLDSFRIERIYFAVRYNGSDEQPVHLKITAFGVDIVFPEKLSTAIMNVTLILFPTVVMALFSSHSMGVHCEYYHSVQTHKLIDIVLSSENDIIPAGTSFTNFECKYFSNFYR